MATIDIQGFIDKLNNGEIDLDTWAAIVNSNDLTVETRLNGNVNTWSGLQAALSAATGRVFFTKAQMDASPGTMQWQAARVSDDGNNTGLYIWSGSAWVKTKDPLTDFDSITVNRGKPFPLRSATRAGTTSGAMTAFSNLILDIRVVGLAPGKYIRVGYQRNGAAVANPSDYLYGWTFEEHDISNYATTDSGNVRIHHYDNPAPDIDRTGGIQTLVITPALRPKMRIYITVDAAQLPALGASIDSYSSNARPGWSWVVDPSCYEQPAHAVADDSMTINSDKIFPFVSRAHGGVPVAAPSQLVKNWLFPIIDAWVQNADPLYFYMVSGIYNPTNANFPCRWIITKQLRAGFDSQVPSSINSDRIIDYPDATPLYQLNTGIQTVVLSKDGYNEKTYITIDTDAMPESGDFLATTAAQDGFTFIIHPSKYTYPERSGGSPGAWNYEGVKWSYDAATKAASLVWRSGGELRRMQFAPRGINSIPDITSVSRAPLGDPETAAWVEIRSGGDTATPPICNFAAASGDGTTDPLYTGGNHGTVNAGGSPTGRNTVFVFMPDGVPVTDTSSGVAANVYFVAVNRVFGANTISLSRETMEQRGAYKFVDGAFLPRIKWTALEDVRLVTDNGPQAITTGFDTGTMMYYGKVNSRVAFDSVTDSGAKPDFPDVFAISFKDSTNGELIVWMDRQYEAGDGRYVQDTRPLIRGGGTGNPKFYHAAVSTVVANVADRPLLSGGESYEWRGGFIMRASQPSIAGFDAVMVNPEFPDEVLAIRDNGLIA